MICGNCGGVEEGENHLSSCPLHIPYPHEVKTKLMKHTPGPWDGSNGYQILSVDTMVAICPSPNKSRGSELHSWDGAGDEEREANARLIAAAPELLEALKLASKLFAQDGLENPDAEFLDEEEVKKIAHAAIAKAEGRA